MMNTKSIIQIKSRVNKYMIIHAQLTEYMCPYIKNGCFQYTDSAFKK
jgi:hypothetical protein